MTSAFGVQHEIGKFYMEERAATPAEKAKAIGKHPRLHPFKRRGSYVTYASDDGDRGTERGTVGHMGATVVPPGKKGRVL